MFYEFDDEITSVDLNEISKNKLYAGLITPAELEKNYAALHINLSTVELCKQAPQSGLINSQIFDDYTFLSIGAYNDDRSGCFGASVILFRNILIVIENANGSTAARDCFTRLLSESSCENITVEKLVCDFFELIAGDGKIIKTQEESIAELEKAVIEYRAGNDFSSRLTVKKSEVLRLRSFYEQIIETSEILIENRNELFDENYTQSFNVLKDKATRFKENTDILRDNLLHLWDAYQTCLAIKQNETMKLFTVLTSVFMPMTVIVGWYGMNFKYMPELGAKWGYPFAIALNVAAVGILLFIFKRKKWI